MTNNRIDLVDDDGNSISFIDNGDPASGSMKDVYFSPDGKYVVAFYKKVPDDKAMERIRRIVGKYRKGIFDGENGAFWTDLFCWPTSTVKWGDRIGIVCPKYNEKFFFDSGRRQGKEKEGKWFASAKLVNMMREPQFEGTFFTRIKMCLQIARAVRRMHAAGLAHSDLSYKNVLVDPTTGSACVIDVDGLVVNGLFPPDVAGTPDFIAPEVLETSRLPKDDPARKLPSRYTDMHALAVLVYMYLLNRHPLRGKKVHSADADEDERLSMGEKALFVEHPSDSSNRPDVSKLGKFELPQGDVGQRPYDICGPFLKQMFERAFINGLHNPEKRPTAAEWEDALIKTVDLLQPCTNPNCSHKWFVFDNKSKPKCPFCGTEYSRELPVLDFYYSPGAGKPYHYEGCRLMVYDQQCLFKWNANRNCSPNEKLSPEDKIPLGDFQLINGHWVLINRNSDSMYIVQSGGSRKKINRNAYVELRDGIMLILDDAPGGRLARVTLANKK